MESRKYTFNKSTLTVRFGNIIESQAEVIVSSDDCFVSMGGGVSRAILEAGGPTIYNDAHKMLPAALGNVVVTTAGKLGHQKYIYHCITIDKKRRMQICSRQVTEEDVLNYLLQHSVDECFKLMQAMDIESIAFPTIGAGNAKIPVQKVIEQMSDAFARNLAHTNRSLNVELYIFDVYNIFTRSDYIALYENLAAKAALIDYKNSALESDDGSDSHFVLNENVPQRDSMTHKVFVSYSRKDMVAAENLCALLKKNDIEYWIDKEGVYSSLNYKEVIVDAIEVSKALIFISSASSNDSVNVAREIGYAVNMEKPILPLTIDDAPFAKSIRLDISDIEQIDFRNPISAEKKLITSLTYVLNT